MTSLTIADVEWKHGRHRARCNDHGKTAWSTFVSSAINQEAKILHDRLYRQNNPAKKQSRQELQDEDARTSDTYLRAQNALQLYRIDCIRRDQHLPKPPRFCTTAYWTKVKEEFAALPEERRAAYEKEAETTKETAQAARKSAKREREAEVVAALPGSVVEAAGPQLADGAVGAESDEVAQRPMLATAHLHLSGERPGGTRPPAPLAGHGQANLLSKLSAYAGEVDAPYALAERLLERHLRDDAGDRRSMAAVSRDFQQAANTMVGNMSAAEDGFPSQVTYARCCPAFCLCESPAEKLRLCQGVQDALAQVVSAHGPAGDIANHDVLLAVSMFDGHNTTVDRRKFFM
eukprot:2039022-Lingulodinium_polyedra.AAC.1